MSTSSTVQNRRVSYLVTEHIQHPLLARVMHWSWVVIMILMLMTGFYLHDRSWMPVFGSVAVAWPMHFVFAVLLAAVVGGRILYSFAIGDFHDLMLKPKDIHGLMPVMRYYLFLDKREPVQGKYNAAQRAVYSLIWPGLLGIQFVTGLGLYLLPGVVWVRALHFIAAWLLVVTIIAHIYLGAIHGWSLIKSMITGKEA